MFHYLGVNRFVYLIDGAEFDFTQAPFMQEKQTEPDKLCPIIILNTIRL
ncbi:hypothetical protein UWK_03230 [Desulfocapsa sulfexigens DSM 10523]|uniref:Uncharacterized protein n=1 Tax=Desulfocapsa sulfexigens (strain DSM 10523 / SB164P1) TaxID=1167006 RepID=M1PDU1_DESSD|nr:hypothetical protein UWK_03230 [Desulfocapsa sulfexigens DSM 10523]